VAVRVWFDGACQPNPGHGGWGIVVRDDAGKLIHTDHGYLGPESTNNIAELYGIIRAMEWLKWHPEMRPATVIGDSQLALNMGLGKWKAREAHLIPLRNVAVGLYKELEGDGIKLEWVPRLSNSEADEESNAGVQRRGAAQLNL
jgi:ribonuclease HI